MKFDDLYSLIEEEAYPQQSTTTNNLIEFIRERKKAAGKIHIQSSRKPGPARLTAKHFEVKLPVYDKAIKLLEDNKSLKVLKKEYMSILAQLRKNRQPVKFQELTGKLEALGEILIKSSNM